MESGGAIESTAAMAIDGFGISMRALGYRPMIAVDEFFKTMARGMEIQALAHRAGSDAEKAVRLNLKDSGKNPTQIKLAADKAYQAAYAKTLNSQQAFEEASEFARMVTFQDDLPGALGNAGKFFNNPVIKIWVPFYKTPTQIVRRVSERTPLALMMPSVIKDKLINGNPRQRKEALVRMSTGTALFGTTMFVASGGVNEDFVITGLWA